MDIDLDELRRLANLALDGEPGAWDELIHDLDGSRVLDLIEVAEAAQAIAVCIVPAVGGFPMIAPNSAEQVARLEASLAPFKETP